MKMTNLKAWLLGAAASMVLATAACGKKEEKVEPAPSAAETAKEVAKISLRPGNPSKAGDALAAMSLTDSGTGPLSFAGKKVDGAKATYQDVAYVIPGEDASIKFGQVEFEGLDMTDSGASFSRLSLSNIEIVPPEADKDTGALTVSKIELLNPSPELAAWVASLGGEAGPAPFPAYDKLSFDAATLNGFKFRLNETDEDVTFDMGDVRVLGFGADKIGTLQIAGFTLDAYDGKDDTRIKMSLGDMTLTGAKKAIIDAMVAGAQAQGNDEAFAQALTEAMYADPMDPGFDTFNLDGLAFDGEGVSFAMPSLQAMVTRDKDGQPARYVTKPYAMTLSADANGGEWGAQLAGALGMLGYEKLELTGEGVATFDPAKDTATYEKSTLKLKDGFELNITGTFGGLKAYGEALKLMDFAAMDGGDPSAMMNAVSKLSLYDMTLTLKDDSIVDRIINLSATQSGQDPAELRNQVVMMASMGPMMAAQSGVDPELATELSTAISSFIQKPGTLTISLKPKAPLNAQSFTSPEQITKGALGLSATAK